jgi:hypothetical protein
MVPCPSAAGKIKPVINIPNAAARKGTIDNAKYFLFILGVVNVKIIAVKNTIKFNLILYAEDKIRDAIIRVNNLYPGLSFLIFQCLFL